MKRGKEDEQVMGPMFPRLHVNEREKGGPRAPPRNKMALYEQLSIPSQRFNPGLNPNHNTSSAASSIQGSGNKRPVFSPLDLPRSTPVADNSNAASSEYNMSSVVPQKRLDEEDFAVPIFVQLENDQNNKNSDNVDRTNVSLSRPAQIDQSSRNQSSNKDLKLSRTRISNVRQKDKCQMQKLQCPPEDQEDGEHLTNDVDGSQSSNDALHHEVIDVSQMQSVHSTTSNGEYHKDKTGYSLGIRSRDECDDGSDTSVVDSVSGVCITPDEVVGVIGQKHFLKARRAIVNQQRVFAVQVFELHRLIKVQKLFAGSPDIIHEDASFVGKTLETSIPKQISFEFIVKPPANIKNCKEDHLKNPSKKTEGSAETAVGKSSLSSSQNISHNHPSNGIPFSPNPQSTPVTTDPSSSPWYFNQATGHHWLVPVMSPTEGLIYKPYAGPGCSGSNPMMSNFSNPPYGMPNSHPYGVPNCHPYGMFNFLPFFHGMGVPPTFPCMTHQGYFPPYGMPPTGPAISGSVVDQGNHSMGTNFIEQQQNSYSGPTQKNDGKPNTPNFVGTRMDRENELQVSTASSPGERSNGLKLFLTSADDGAAENQTRAIKVVPHNAVSANESAFRIFQSIQKEREQYEPV